MQNIYSNLNQDLAPIIIIKAFEKWQQSMVIWKNFNAYIENAKNSLMFLHDSYYTLKEWVIGFDWELFVHGSNMFARSNSYLIKLASEKISLMKDMD